MRKFKNEKLKHHALPRASLPCALAGALPYCYSFVLVNSMSTQKIYRQSLVKNTMNRGVLLGRAGERKDGSVDI